MPTFLHALAVVSLVGAGGFFLFAFGACPSQRTSRLPSLTLSRLIGSIAGASLLWLADVLEHNRHDARRWGRSLIYVRSGLFHSVNAL
jgi:hypothetical protein